MSPCDDILPLSFNVSLLTLPVALVFSIHYSSPNHDVCDHSERHEWLLIVATALQSS